MSAYRTQDSLVTFYTEALAAGDNTAENLQAPITPEFAEMITTAALTGAARTAVDIGYGAGAYSIALAQHGFKVEAVDRVPAQLLTERLPSADWAHRINTVTSRIEDYTIPVPLGVLVAKDVLHYLAPDDVCAILDAGVRASVPGSCHYLHVFTDIRRTGHSGDSIQIEGELGWSTEEFTSACTQLYRGWSLLATAGAHTERDRRTGRPYFEATRNTLIAQRPQQ
ncbi:hypothetical protein FEK35_23390 [Nocardia cyriacigeorgica]|uniref:Class I SAM-dependent methyltransferase n=1 Tax=Nocardia cyriacigeorgica TaxID=135487 RepID=A0A5R8P9J2_9NOCA|nr:hypothetical protein [Nocardia cyriacigeorgica]TLG01806.1 hypothetical protein FEK35_23390 [Nocardia cyriacigeorgica]